MQQNYTPESFRKGQQFEEFVEKNIFTEDRYELITRTNSFEQNATRYAEDTMKPDFKFRCKETGREFWVEAKYRSDFFQDQIEALSYRQRDRFYVLEKDEDIPVFVIIGYWGVAYKPNGLSLIPLKDYKYIQIFRSFLKQYDIPIQPISNETLSFKEERRKGKNDSNFEERTEEKVLEEEDQPPTIKKSYSANPKILGLAALGLVAIILAIYSFTSTETTPEKSHGEHLKEIVADYYQSVNSNQIEAIPDFLSPRVDQWYGAKNLSHSEILKIARDRHGKYPFSSSDINWDSFTVIPQSTGGFLVTYEMTHKFKKKIIDDYQIYYLKLYTTWDEDLKLKSIREIKN